MKTVQFSEEVVEYHVDSDHKNDSFYEKLMTQRLPGQIPIVNARIVISLTIFFAFTFLAISLLIKGANDQVRLEKIPYHNIIGDYIEFSLPEQYENPVYFYYELRNTLQTFRQVNNAMCKAQLLTNNAQSSEQCDPEYPIPSNYYSLHYICENELSNWKNEEVSILQKQCTKDNSSYYAPMGGLASIMFNDTFRLVRLNHDYRSNHIEEIPIHWTDKGLVADSTKSIFGHPNNDKNLCDSEMFRNTAKPVGWSKHICEMGGYRNDSFIIWMSMTAYRNFKKAYRILDSSKHPTGLRSGTYRLYVTNNYYYHNMEKYFWILHPSYMGTELVFLQHLYLIVGTGLLCLSIGLIGMQIFLLDRYMYYSTYRRKKFDDDE